MGKFIDLTGQKFGRLTVLSRTDNNKHRQVMWLCQCKCGNFIVVRGYRLKDGHTKSCGCLNKEQAIINVSKHHSHKLSNTRLYQTWQNIKKRCLNYKDKNYKNYGGRGIEICNEWLNPNNFFKWALNNGYSDNLTIDRIDNNKGYTPNNCRWTTLKTQANNKRNNHLLTFKGKTKTMIQWADKFKINYYTLSTRLKRNWTTERALTEQVYSG